MLRSITSCTRRSVVSKSQSSVYFFERRGTREFSSMDVEDVSFKRVYTHPLSQTVLEHLQNVHGEWLMRNGLDRGLTINRGEHVFLKCSVRQATSVYVSLPVALNLSSHRCICARPSTCLQTEVFALIFLAMKAAEFGMCIFVWRCFSLSLSSLCVGLHKCILTKIIS